MMLGVVDCFTTMAHCIQLNKEDSPTVARTYLENVLKYHDFPEDVVLDRDGTFTGQSFTDPCEYFGDFQQHE